MGAHGFASVTCGRDNHERVLGLLEQEQIALSCNIAATHKALSHSTSATKNRGVAFIYFLEITF